MDAILIYDKETGNIVGASNAESVDLFLTGNLSPYLTNAKTFDDEGNEIGSSEIHLFDPDKGFLWVRNPFPTLSTGLIYLTTKSDEEVKAELIPDIQYPEYKVPMVVNGVESEMTFILQRIVNFTKGIDSSGKITKTIKTRKRILEEDYENLISGFSLDGFPENESETINKILSEYKIEVDSATNTKKLVLRG